MNPTNTTPPTEPSTSSSPTPNSTPGQVVGGTGPGDPSPGPATPGQVATPGATVSPTMGATKPNSGKKKLPKWFLILLIALLVLGGATAAAYFGYIIPNKPENIWAKAMVNTGKGFDKLSEYVNTVDMSKGSKVDGSFKQSGPVAADGTITGQSDGQNSEGKMELSVTGLKITAETKAIKSTGTSPDFYIKVSGIQGIGTLLGGGSPELTKILNGVNNQWYVIDHTLFDQMNTASPSIKREDVNKLIDAMAATNKKYIFTDDVSKSILVVKENVGKETKDGRHVYHYKVSFNKENLKAYVSEACENFKNSKLVEAPKAGSGDAEVQANQIFNCTSATKAVDDLDTSSTADVWVDLKTKLVQTVRFSEKKSADNYIDLVQSFTGGDEFPFSLKFQSKEDKTTTSGQITMTLNMKTDVISITGDVKSTGTDEQSGNLKLTIAPSEETVKVVKPTNAKSIIELMNDLGIPNFFQAYSNPASPTGTNIN